VNECKPLPPSLPRGTCIVRGIVRTTGGAVVEACLRVRICRTLRAPSNKAIHTIRVDENRLQ